MSRAHGKDYTAKDLQLLKKLIKKQEIIDGMFEVLVEELNRFAISKKAPKRF